jgi:hypothetical protein
MLDTGGDFYLGRIYDVAAGKTGEEPLLYDPADLTTHAVVVGMTGSGKTGLCIDLLEEAALNNIPALMIDPKGDITNTLLHFPNLAPADFQPWVNPDEARRQDKPLEQAAADTAALWRNGLAGWGIHSERLQALKDSAHFAVYTPGSDAGLPISILTSFDNPGISWEGNEEELREKISSTVTALLGLVGLKDIDPVRSREHILLANIIEHAWKQGQDLSLSDLIRQTQAPPFAQLGVFDVNTFYPEKERFGLAMTLNSILAAPSFQAWISGDPLDVGRLLYDDDGRCRHSVFYIAHLNEAERSFFVTLLFAAVEGWMRQQSGTTSLRALVYFDEIFGYMPPIGNPPSKEPMLRMLKQARAFGVGLVLCTQNPVDVDYKALSNAGTWFIGKLSTEQDKARLLDGLSSAVPGSVDVREYDRLISALGKRIFLMRNVHEKKPLLFETRWAMNYLAGPLTRTQLPALNALAGATAAVESETPANGPMAAAPTGSRPDAAAPISSATASSEASAVRPAIPSAVEEYFLPDKLTLSEAAAAAGLALSAGTRQSGLAYRPVLLAQASIRFQDRQYNLDHELRRAALVTDTGQTGLLRWEDFAIAPLDAQTLGGEPLSMARFETLPPSLAKSQELKAFQKDFFEWVCHNTSLKLQANKALRTYSSPDMSVADFAEMCRQAAAEAKEADIEKVEATFEKKLDELQEKLERAQDKLAAEESDYSARKQEELVKHAETIFGLFTRRRRSVSSSMTKRRLTAQAREDVEEAKEDIEQLEADIVALQREMEQALQKVEAKWREVVADTTEISLKPAKKNIVVECFGIAWLPYYLVQTRDENEQQIPAFG